MTTKTKEHNKKHFIYRDGTLMFDNHCPACKFLLKNVWKKQIKLLKVK